jgi:hypothetical protein
MTTQLTLTQHAVLAYAVHNNDGKIVWFPDNIKGGARQKVLDGLFNRALITRDASDCWVAAEGYEALGCACPERAPVEADPELVVAVTAAEATWAQETGDSGKPAAPLVAEPKPRTREHSKQADVIRMLQRPEGATIPQICEATGWQAHTVRGTFAGAFKKKLGLNIVSEKPAGGERAYRIA